MQRSKLTWGVTVICLSRAPARALPAFPGAEGFGANALGGRGGEVFHVNNTGTASSGTYEGVNGYNRGTLRWCLTFDNTTLPRTVVFDVSGQVTLTSQITLENSFMTIAGQTAPGQGMSIAGRGILVESSDHLVVRHIRARPGRNSGSSDAMGVEGGQNIIFDHVTASWSGDEGLSVAKQGNNVSVQNSFIYEILNYNDHGYGSLIRPDIDSKVTYHHNLYADNISRNPRPGTYGNRTLDFDFRNNVVYNYLDAAGYTGGSEGTTPEPVNMNYVGNYVIPGPSSIDNINTAFEVRTNGSLKAFQLGNKIDSDLDSARDGVDSGWGMFEVTAGSLTQMGAEFPLAPLPVSTDSADDAYAKVLAAGGAFPWNRDTSDARIVNQVKTQTGSIIDQESQVGGYPLLPVITRPANWDTDFDGMPNWWETARGFNPNSSPDRNNIGPNGYTNLENYLNYLTLQANWAVNGDGNWAGILNWAGTLPNSMDATAGFGSIISAPRTVTVDSPVTVGQILFDSAHGYTLSGGGAISIDVISGHSMIDVLNGTHTIAAPVVLLDDLSLTVGNGAGILFTGNVTATGRTITKQGAGLARFENVRSNGLVVNGGTVRTSAKPQANDPSGTSVVSSLLIGAGAQLDLTNNSLVIDYTGPVGSLLDTMRQALQSGALISSVADTSKRLGYVDNATHDLTDFSGQPVDDSSVLIAFTFVGDSDLDGDVDISDLGNLASSWQTSGTWGGGDFDYNGLVDVTDLGMLASNWQAGANLANALAALGLPSHSVPEPASIAVVSAMSLCLTPRPRRITRQCS